jgi:uncharacterized protein YbjT (DUF2867 family)
MKIVVIGGTGLIGSKLVKKLREHGQDVVAASPSSGVNSVTGEGLADALKGASVAIDVTNSPSWEDAAAMEFFTKSTRNLLEYEAARAWDITLPYRSSERSVCSKAPSFAPKLLRRT